MAEFLEESGNHEHKYNVSKPKTTTKNQPTPFTTSTLQQKASNECNFSPKQTMRLAQTLYENGHITYIRTDSTFISEEFQTQLHRKVQMDYGDGYYQKSKEKKYNY